MQATRVAEATNPRRGQGAIRIVLVEDHVILKEGLVALLEIEQDLEIVGEARDAPVRLNWSGPCDPPS